MNPLIQLKNAIPLFLIGLACFGLLPASRAVSPPPDGGYPGQNTAEGDDALFSLTTGESNTAVGRAALFSDTTGMQNTAIGTDALISNTTGNGNTALGFGTLSSNTTGFANTATGLDALGNNTTGTRNTANGFFALFGNTTASNNTASGFQALQNNTTGSHNTATGTNALFNNNGNHNTANGAAALQSNRGGAENTATGSGALFKNTVGNFNTAVGVNALFNATGDNNVAIGDQAGINLTTGSNNIDIGAFGAPGDSETIRIGRQGLQNSTFIQGIFGVAMSGSVVVVNQSGKLGVTTSSARFKDEIKLMDKASEAVLALQPVTFRYKKDIDPEGTRQFGLIAEQVEKVDSDLVVRDKEGKPFSVRYEAIKTMLLNKFLKEHTKTEKLEATVASLIATVKEQAAQIQKVSAELEASKPAPQVVNNP